MGVSTIAPDGARLAYNGTRPFAAAGMGKIAVLVELFRRFDADGSRSARTIDFLMTPRGPPVVAMFCDGSTDALEASA